MASLGPEAEAGATSRLKTQPLGCGLWEQALTSRSSHNNVNSVVGGARLLVHGTHHVVIEL